jgi:hypothetical protein
MLCKGMTKSCTGIIVAALFAFTFDYSASSLVSQPALPDSNGFIQLNELPTSDILPEHTLQAIQIAPFESTPRISLVNSDHTPKYIQQGSTLDDKGSRSHTGLTWYSYSTEQVTDFCQPPDRSSPLCDTVQTFHTPVTQNLPVNFPLSPEEDEQQVNAHYQQNEFITSFPPPSTISPTIEAMIALVNQEQIVNFVGNLSGALPVEINGEIFTITSRYSFSEQIHVAAEYLYRFYQDQGLAVTYQYFDFQGVTLSNVVAELPGSIFPDQVYLITAHYDSLPAGEIAPGADDNASGVAAVMMAAQILSQYDFACTLRFVNFAAEEQYLVGSQHYAQESRSDQDDIRAVLNLDMIAWNTPGSNPTMNLHANWLVPGSVELAEYYTEVIRLYEFNLDPLIFQNGTNRSDHASFWAYNIPAILAIEDFNYDFNQNYHTADDILESLKDLKYFTNMVKAAVATLAHLGCLVEEGWGEVAGFIRDGETDLPIAGASVSFYNPIWDYTNTVTTGDNGYFQISLVAGPHDLIVNAPGYAPEYYSDINIEKDQVHFIDFNLDYVYNIATYFPLLVNKPE